MYTLLCRISDGLMGEFEASNFVNAYKDRVRHIPSSLPPEFVLIHAPTPVGGDFDDWMQGHREKSKQPHELPYSCYGAHPRRHLAPWASRVLGTQYGLHAYFVPHRKAKQHYEYKQRRAPFLLHYEFAYPVFQTIDLSRLEVARGPYAGQHVITLFDEPGVFLVKQSYSVQKCEHRRSIVYATWCAKLASPYGTWRKDVR